MNKKVVVAYKEPSDWKCAVLEAGGDPSEAAMEVSPYYTDPLRKESLNQCFEPDEIAEIEGQTPTKASVFVRQDEIDGSFHYRKIIADGNSVPNFCEVHFDTVEAKVEILLRNFLANLGASDISVYIEHETTTSETKGTGGSLTVEGGVEGCGSGKIKTAGQWDRKSGTGESTKVVGMSEKNEPDFVKAEQILKKSSWLKDNFVGLLERVRNGQVKGKEGTSITHVINDDYMSNLKVAVDVAAKYELISAAVGIDMKHSVEKHKKEKVILRWSCDFA